ncbi:MAG TPA: molybdopterin-dependent oxidoreductase [Candidatus Gordonibacter avicola]|nr:molybdopterin-dependent oxidoreductase [Candidatus Gordonibacter avicola]
MVGRATAPVLLSACTCWARGYPELDYATAFPEKRYDDPDYTLSKVALVVGKNPLVSNPDGLFGHALVDMMKRGTELIIVDPRATWLASRAKYFLQLRPGTDAALYLSMCNVIIDEDLYDHEFCDNWIYGFNEFAERCREYKPDVAAAITGVNADLIREAARYWATNKPGSMTWGLAVDQKCNGIQTATLVLLLCAITGNLDVPGGVLLGASDREAPTSWWGWDELDPEIQAKRIGAAEYPAVSTACSTTQPDMAMDAIMTDKPYPIKMTFTMSSNPIACPVADPQMVSKAMLRPDFNVFADLVMTPSAAAYGDLFLPVASSGEKDGLVGTHYGALTLFVAACVKGVQTGECKSDDEIMLDLGWRLNPSKFPWKDLHEFLTWELNGYGIEGTFDDLVNSETGFVTPPYEYEKYAYGLQTWNGEPGFGTPSGKVEAYCQRFVEWGDDALPYYEEPPYSPVSTPDLFEKYPFVLTTGARSWSYFHSEQRHIERLRDLDPWPTAEMNPADAERLGLKDGDWVYLTNMFGKCRQMLKVTPIVKPGVIMAKHGWWYPEKGPDDGGAGPFGVWDANINQLVPHNCYGKLGFGTPFKCMICNVEKAEGGPDFEPAWPKTNNYLEFCN